MFGVGVNARCGNGQVGGVKNGRKLACRRDCRNAFSEPATAPTRPRRSIAHVKVPPYVLVELRGPPIDRIGPVIAIDRPSSEISARNRFHEPHRCCLQRTRPRPRLAGFE